MIKQRNLWFALLVLLNLIACSKSPSGEAEDNAASAPVPEVTVAKAARADISRFLDLPATVGAAPNRDVKISPLVAGIVAEINLAEGDRVRQGQVVARLDETPLREELRRAEGAVAQARANLENATLALQRDEDLLRRGIAARKEVEDARTQQQVAQASLQQAESDVALAQLKLQRVQITSPLSGVVVKRFVNAGEQVDGTPAQPVMEVADLSEVDLEAAAPPSEISRMRVGDSISFASEIFPGRRFTGRIAAISPAVDPAANAASLRIRVANSDGLLRLGMNLTARIAVETHRNAVVVPPEAIYRDQQGAARVYRVEGTSAKAVPVEIGIETPDQVEILAGINPGDTIVVQGGYGLEDEAKIAIKPDQAPEAR